VIFHNHTLDYIRQAGRELLNILFCVLKRNRRSGNDGDVSLTTTNGKLKNTVENYLSYFASAPGFEMKTNRAAAKGE
jgi:hypothetical protein